MSRVKIEEAEIVKAYYVTAEGKRDMSVRVEVAIPESTGKVSRVTVAGTELTARDVWAIIKLWESGKIPLPEF